MILCIHLTHQQTTPRSAISVVSACLFAKRDVSSIVKDAHSLPRVCKELEIVNEENERPSKAKGHHRKAIQGACRPCPRRK